MFSQAALNASLNGTSAILLACGYAAIRNGKMKVHKAFMIAAFSVSTVFLISYVIYHYPRWACGFPRSGLDSAGLFRAATFAHRTGDRHRAV